MINETRLLLKKFYKHSYDMFIKLITIIVITNLYIVYEQIDSKGILLMLPEKLDYILIISFFVFLILTPNLISNKFNNKYWIQILTIIASTSFSAVHVATGFIFGIAINILFHDFSAGIDSIKLVFGFLLILWVIVLVVSYTLENILEKMKNGDMCKCKNEEKELFL